MKGSKWLWIAACVIVNILFLTIPFFRWRFTDDFSFEQALSANELFIFLSDWYMHWDAHFLMPFYIIWFAMVKYLGTTFLMFLGSLSFLLSSWYMLRIFLYLFKLRVSGSSQFVLATVLNLLLWLSLFPILSHTLYWKTCTAYIHMILASFIWMYAYLKMDETKRIPILFYVFTFFVATCAQNICLGLLALISADFVIHWKTQKQKMREFYSGARFKVFVVFFTGVVLSTFSPGSFVQFAKMQSSSYTGSKADLSMRDYGVHFFKLYQDALETNSLILLICAALFSIFMYHFSALKLTEFKIRLSALYTFPGWLPFLKGGKWFLMPFACLMIYWPTLLTGQRYYIGFYFFLFLAVTILLGSQFGTVEAKEYKNKSLNFLMASVLVFGTYKLSTTLKEGYYISKFMDNREAVLESQRGAKKVYLDALDLTTFTRTVRTTEISENPNHYPNVNYADYYDIDSIIANRIVSKYELIK